MSVEARGGTHGENELYLSELHSVLWSCLTLQNVMNPIAQLPVVGKKLSRDNRIHFSEPLGESLS